MRSSIIKILLVLLVSSLTIPAIALTYNYSFEASLEGWTTKGAGGAWTINSSQSHAYLDIWSVEMSMTAFDPNAGTFIENSFTVVPGYQYDVTVRWKFGTSKSTTAYPDYIVAAISSTQPGLSDYVSLGSTYNGGASGLAWLSKEFTSRITPQSDKIYIGLGVTSQWESSYVYYLDAVTVEIIPVGQQKVSIPNARKLADGAPVLIEHVGCASGLDDIMGLVYIENLDCTSGIAVELLPDSIGPGRNDLVIAEGFMDTTENGERILRNTMLTYSPLDLYPDIRPVFISNKAVGGGPFGDYLPEIFGSKGVNNTGLLITTTGKVVAQGDGFFVIDDGGRSESSGKAPVNGIAVSTTGVFPWKPITLPDNPGQMSVTGFVSCWKDTATGKIYPFIQPRGGADVFPLDR